MGPVSFARILLGTDREAALAAAGRVSEAGIRIDLLSPSPSGSDDQYALMVRSTDSERARALVERE